MAAIQVGCFEIAPQSGPSGETQISHKYARQHTGRNPHIKVVRATLTDPTANVEALETLTVAAKSPFFTLDTNQANIVYSKTEHTINGISNASQFRISTTGLKTITLKSNTGYTIVGNTGMFADGFGVNAQGSAAILIGFSVNNTSEAVSIPVLIEYYTGTEWVEAGIYTIEQGTSDAEVSFSLTPESLSSFLGAGETKQVSISSNIAYLITKQGSSEQEWVTVSFTQGNAGERALDITTAGQNVGAQSRNLDLVFSNQLTGTPIGALTITQLAGENFRVSFQAKDIAFTNEEVGAVKPNTLSCNAPFTIEEKI